MLRCVASIEEFADVKHDLVLVDNGSPEEAHKDMIDLLNSNGYDPEVIWIREKWHPVPVGANAALKHFKESNSDIIVFLTSDMKIGKKFLPLGLQFMSMFKLATFAEPNIGPYYGINNDLKRYRTKEFWGCLARSLKAYSHLMIKYCENHDLKWVNDSWDEPAIVSVDTRQGEPGRRISIFFANRQGVEQAGYYNEEYLRSSEFQYYYQAIEKKCKIETMGYIYLGHAGGIYRTGVGSYNPKQFTKYGPKGDFRFKRGKGNVFATKQ
jgi:hypothetical protein